MDTPPNGNYENSEHTQTTPQSGRYQCDCASWYRPNDFWPRTRIEKASERRSHIHVDRFLQCLHRPLARMVRVQAQRKGSRNACIAHAKGSRRRSCQMIFHPWAGWVTLEVVLQHLRRSGVVSDLMTNRSRRDPILRRSTPVPGIARPTGGWASGLV